jgi:NitT/TauT family transport system substrate-binding protein
MLRLAVAVLVLICAAQAGAQEKLNVFMNWTIHGGHGPWFIAKQKGYFTAQGLDVNISRGFGSGDTVKKVIAGVADIGYTDPVPIIQAIAEGQPIRVFMGGYMSEPCTVHSAAEGGNITGPKALEGKTFAGPPGDSCIILLPAVMQRAGADASKVKIENMDAPARLPMMAAGRIDAAADFSGAEILWEKGLRQANKRLVSFRYDRYIEKYGLMLIASDKMVKERPETLRKVSLALLRGYEDHIREPDAAAAAILQVHPELDKDYIHSSSRNLLNLIWDETTKARGVGVISEPKMQSTLDLVNTYWKLPKKLTPQDVYTNSFVEWGHAQLKR